VTAEPAPGPEFFTAPAQPNQRRYEALRAYFTERLSVAEAGARAGYTRASMASLLRDFRAGRLALFAEPGRPGPKSAPRKDAARARVIELRRQGLSVYEISSRLRAEGTPLNRTGVGQVLAEEGFGRPAAGHPRPGRPGPARNGGQGRLPGHRGDPGGQPHPVPAGAEADGDPAGVPRR
jgi:transposase